MRRHVPAVLLGALVLGLTGCATPGGSSPRASQSRLPPGRVLVVPRASGPESLPVAAAAAQRLAGALRGAADVLGPQQFLGESSVAGLSVRAPRLLGRLADGAWPEPGESQDLLERAGILTLVAVQVTVYEQVWAPTGKWTRVGLAAEAFHLPTREVLWQVRAGAEIEKERGRAFRLALEQASARLAETIRPASPLAPVRDAFLTIWPSGW
jgi:hypothetical protein